MRVDKIKRSQSMWTINTGVRYSVTSSPVMTPVRSNSVISTSTWSISGMSDAGSSSGKKNLVQRFRKGPRKSKGNVQTTRYTLGPVLTGDVDAVDSQGRSLLFYAARYGQVETAGQLVETGCDPNQKDCIGNSPLHEAIDKGHLDVAETFLKSGTADVNLPGCNGDTPIMLAVSRGQLEAIRLLHRYGADVNLCDEVGNPPIYKALQRGWNEVADFLLDNQCDVTRTTANGMTCFFAAAHSNKIETVNIARRLLKTDYDFKKDTEWLATEGCPVTHEDNPKIHNKVLVKAGLKQNTRKASFLSNGRQKLMRTLRRLSTSSG